MTKEQIKPEAFLNAINIDALIDYVIDAAYIDERGELAISPEKAVKVVLTKLKEMVG